MKPRVLRRRWTAEPTRPRWPAMKILADLSERKEEGDSASASRTRIKVGERIRVRVRV